MKRRTGLAAAVLAALFALPVAELTEVWRITDDSGKFFFQYPGDLQVAADGSIFLLDMPERG